MHWRRQLQADLLEAVTELPPVAPLSKMDDPQTVAHLPAPTRRARMPAAKLGDGLTSSDMASKLEHLTHRALDKADEILDIELDPDDEKYGDNLRGLNAAIKTVVATQVRVDEHRLKARKLDALPELLALIAEEEAKRLAL